MKISALEKPFENAFNCKGLTSRNCEKLVIYGTVVQEFPLPRALSIIYLPWYWSMALQTSWLVLTSWFLQSSCSSLSFTHPASIISSFRFVRRQIKGPINNLPRHTWHQFSSDWKNLFAHSHAFCRQNVEKELVYIVRCERISKQRQHWVRKN